ncbi:MAG: hypothetical protein FH756_13235 [Firmicutes bacterium]|nr:hypothetical protein [Bacillota bacterium]
MEKDGITQYSAQYSYTTDSSDKITSIQLENITSKLLLKEVSTLAVSMDSFDITYVDETTATYNYSTDSSGRITAINKV